MNADSRQVTIRGRQNRCLYITLIFLFILGLLRDAIDVPVNQFFLLGAASIFYIVADYKSSVYYTCFILAICVGINSAIIGIALFSLIMKSKHSCASQYVFWVVISVIECLTFSSLSVTNTDFKQVVFYSSYIGLFFFMTFDATKELDYAKMLRLFLYGIMMVFILIVLRRVMVDGSNLLLMDVRFGEVDESNLIAASHFHLNPNNVGYLSVVGYAILLLGRERIGMRKAEYVASFFLILLPGVLTVSRTWMLLIAFFTLLYALFYLSRLKLIVLIIALMSGGASFLMSDNLVVDSFRTRFEDKNMSTAGGRTEISMDYLRFFESHPEYWMVGTGATYYVKESHCSWNSLHNGSIQILFCHGVIGVLLYIIVLLLFRAKFARRKISFLFFFPIAAAFLFVQTIQFLNPFFLMLPFILGCVSIKYGVQLKIESESI